MLESGSGPPWAQGTKMARDRGKERAMPELEPII